MRSSWQSRGKIRRVELIRLTPEVFTGDNGLADRQTPVLRHRDLSTDSY